ncbi:MAG: 1,4-alpha-glucan branching protein GlgB [Anaeromusa sp.]|uniref:1,4-alpha-glucan branching protein GlgB n=1 Tax=Anaeromusa sp. TaxID=1872520 RepID=UPI002B213BA1|nr:1,4-alpha-glucan branching protein GlgB [Anaeromusa sp.]MEA4835709.1 1,4-alpha-glucan branching protein GlgB [Anaeromusa sp.]
MSKYQEILSPQALFFELEAFSEGRSTHAWRCFGAHPAKTEDGTEGYLFRVWAPNAPMVTLIGDFNHWDLQATPMERVEGGIWEAFVPGLHRYDAYQYAIHTLDGKFVGKADPYGVHSETRPNVSSKIYDLGSPAYQWGDQSWMAYRAKQVPYTAPMNTYECHLGSWRRTGSGDFLSYRDTASYLVPYIKEMGFTHVELLPVTEHPLDASWGYQCTGYFAATSRFGTPDDLKYLVDELHQAGIGVIMDWVPAHFPRDAFGLYSFDGSPTYEYADPRKGEHADWGTNVFDYGRKEVRSFLLSSAMFWLEEYHMDGLRVDAVSSMLYLDYGRKDRDWIPNVNGGHENLEAVEFLQQLNTAVFAVYPDILMIAEESTSWPKVTYPVNEGGLGFNFKWNMGWMNDMLRYMELDPIHRKWHHNLLTFSLMYAFTENFVLPLSHDEVVHGKKSLLNKMPGDYWQKFANLRAFYAYWLAHPGKKLLFMGCEFGQFIEWKHDDSLDWHLLDYPQHQAVHHCVRELNRFYRQHAAFWENDDDWDGFSWLDCQDYEHSVISFLRRDRQGGTVLVVCNFTPVVHEGYRIGVPAPGEYHEVFNTDAGCFGGSGQGNGVLRSEPIPWHSQECSLALRLPPLATVYLRLHTVKEEQETTKDTRGNGYV